METDLFGEEAHRHAEAKQSVIRKCQMTNGDEPKARSQQNFAYSIHPIHVRYVLEENWLYRSKN